MDTSKVILKDNAFVSGASFIDVPVAVSGGNVTIHDCWFSGRPI